MSAINKKERTFIEKVWEFYRNQGRSSLPWRATYDPYQVLVSELMLQQTQVDRVVPKFQTFLKKWPTPEALASASLGEVITEWQGLGYNRRAKFLLQAATYITKNLHGVFPKEYKELLSLPGVGQYTAAAIMAFAYNQPIVLIETNVRQVFIYHFFRDQLVVDDKEIIKLVERTMSTERPRDWYAALMDYGTYLKKQEGNLTRRSNQYIKQSTFKGSDREIRGAILKKLTNRQMTAQSLIKELSFDKERVIRQLANLLAEGMVDKKQYRYTLPT